MSIYTQAIRFNVKKYFFQSAGVIADMKYSEGPAAGQEAAFPALSAGFALSGWSVEKI